MKIASAKTLALLLVVAALAANLVWSCSKDKIFKDTNIYIRTDVMLNPLSIEVQDANPANAPLDWNKVKIEVLGPGRDKIYSVVGERKMKLDGPFLNIGIRKFDRPSLERPLYFAIKATAPGYAEALRWFSITDGEGFRLERLEMVKLDAPPPGASVTVVTFPVNSANGTVSDIVIETEPTAQNPQRARVVIPAGTKMYDEANPDVPLAGTVKATLVHFNYQNVQQFPTGPTGTYIVESNGKPRKPGASAPAGYTSMNLVVGGSQVGTFSGAVNAAITLADDQPNLDTGTPIVPGDSVSIWSLGEPEMTWKKEARVAIEEQNGELWCPWTLEHLSWWAAGWFPPFDKNEQGYEDLDNPGSWNPPASPTVLTVDAVGGTLTDALCQAGGFFYTEVVSARFGFRVLSDYQQYYGGRQINLATLFGGIPQGGIVWRIYSGSACDKGTLLFESQVITGNATLNIGNALPTDGLQVSLLMEGTCGESTIVIPTAPVLFREAGGGCFRTLGVLRLGEGCTGNLYKGKKYDFAVYFGGLERIVDGITIPQKDSIYVFDNLGFQDSLYIRYSGANNNSLLLDYRNVKIPDDLCEEFKKYFF